MLWVWILGWWILGAVGMAAGLAGDLKKGQSLTVGSVVLGAFMAFGGLIVFFMGVYHLLEQYKVFNFVIIKGDVEK